MALPSAERPVCSAMPLVSAERPPASSPVGSVPVSAGFAIGAGPSHATAAFNDGPSGSPFGVRGVAGFSPSLSFGPALSVRMWEGVSRAWQVDLSAAIARPGQDMKMVLELAMRCFPLPGVAEDGSARVYNVLVFEGIPVVRDVRLGFSVCMDTRKKEVDDVCAELPVQVRVFFMLVLDEIFLLPFEYVTGLVGVIAPVPRYLLNGHLVPVSVGATGVVPTRPGSAQGYGPSRTSSFPVRSCPLKGEGPKRERKATAACLAALKVSDPTPGMVRL